LLAVTISASTGLEALRSALERAVAGGGGIGGVAVLHVESGERASIRGAESFPMASVMKVPVALLVLHRVDQGTLSLDQAVRLAPSDYRPWAGSLADAAARGVSLSVRDLLGRMLVESDNGARDVLLGLAGGPPAVTARLRELGVSGLRVDRPEGEIGLAEAGVEPIPPPSTCSRSCRAAARSPARAPAWCCG